MKNSSWKAYNERGKVMRRARDLARSGQHQDCTSIIRQLEVLEGFSEARNQLQDSAILSQIDKLCALARPSRVLSEAAA